DARRLERLQEATRKAHRHAVAVPLQITPPGTEAQDEWIGERCPVQVPQKQLARLLVAHVSAAVHHAVADPVLQRDAPLPAGIVRGRTSVRSQWTDRFTGNGHSPVARQPVRPVSVAHIELLPDQEAAETGAVHEEIALYHRSIAKCYGPDETGLRVERDIPDDPLDALNAQALAELSKVTGIEARVEVVGVDESCQVAPCSHSSLANLF